MSGELFGDRYRGRRVLVTGHTGFLGGWTTRWLLDLGALVAGCSRGASSGRLPPGRGTREYAGDVTDPERMLAVMSDFAPDVVIHLAGSTTVAAGFRSPVTTFHQNVMGTASVFDAALAVPTTRAVITIGTPAADVITDGLSLQPYAASKIAAQAVAAAFVHPSTQHAAGRTTPLAVGLAKPGVMIGGDWGEGRLLADVTRAVREGRPVVLGAPNATRPWQHVLDGIGGALLLGDRLASGHLPRSRYSFGRGRPRGAETVRELVAGYFAAYGYPEWPIRCEGDGTGDRLELDCAAATEELGWLPVWDLARALRESAEWYRTAEESPELLDSTTHDVIRRYEQDALSTWVDRGAEVEGDRRGRADGR